MAELKNEFTWSKSRGDTFRTCLRKYYHQYYGSWGGWEPTAEISVRETYILKQLKNRFLWAGEVVHQEVAHILRRLSLGENVTLEESLDRARTRMRQQFADSRARLYREKPKETTGFCEHEYQWPVRPEQWKASWTHVETCLRNFNDGEILTRLKNLGPAAWKIIEDLMTFHLGDIPVFVKLDLAFEKEGQLTVIDWKTSKSENGDKGLFQLGCYALFAREEWGFATSHIRVIEANLYTGRHTTHTLDDEMLDDVAERIRAEVRVMRQALKDPLDNVADLDNFPMTEHRENCRSCNFQKLCYSQGMNVGQNERVHEAVL